MKRWYILLALVLLGWQSKAQAQPQHILVWRSSTTNQVVYWLLNGTSYVSGGVIADGPVDPRWKIVAAGDVTGDGKPDLILQNSSTGQVAYWQMNSTVIQGSGIIASGVQTPWHVVAAADINGDGKTDLLWQNSSTGDVVYWLMNGTTLISYGFIATGISTEWKIVAGTHLGGGVPFCLIWRNVNTGVHSYWILKDNKLSSSGYFNPNFADPSWGVVGVVDLDGNGSPDLIYENSQTNQVSYWLLSGITRAVTNDFLNYHPGLEWSIQAVL